jgi:tetratricopeptide (TPR) repeat protein
MHRLFVSLILVSVCLGTAHLAGQVSQERSMIVNRLLRQADSLLARHMVSGAEDVYRAALMKEPKCVAALMGLGKAGMATRSWTEAIDWFEHAAEVDTGNLDARYLMGISYGERGRARYMLEKVFGFFSENSFEKGREALGWVLARDSVYSDAILQMAFVYVYEHDYAPAIPLALRQIFVTPGLRNAHLGLYKVAREAIGMHQGNVPPGWMSLPLQSYGRFFDAEWERRRGRLDEAERILNGLFPNPGLVRRPLILQSLARIKARQGLTAEAEQLVLDAIDNIRTMGDADIVFEDIKYIISDEELRSYRSMRTGAEAKRFFTTLWTKRNPYPAEQSNARIAEHYRRLVYAEQWFEQFGRKTFAPETMPLDFPQAYFLNEEFNDKGIIYLRHGEPHQKIITARSGSGPAESNESWLYHATDEYPQLLFDFFIPNGGHITEWRLTPVLSDPGMWEDRMEYSHAYLRLMQSPSAAGMYEGITRATDEGRQTVSLGISSDRYSYTKDLTYYESPISFTCFRGAYGQTLVNLGYVIATAEIGKAFPDSVKQFTVAAEYAVYDSSWRKVASSQNERTFTRTGVNGDVMIERFQAAVVPDSYLVAWQAKPVVGNQVFSHKQRVFVPDFSGSSLMMSDLELAYAIEPANDRSGFAMGPLSVVPNPLARCPLNRSLYLYFEAYNLQKDGKGKTAYTVEYQLTSLELEKSFLARLLTANKKTSITVPSERSGNEDWSREYVAIDVSELEPGRYQLQVKLTDHVAKKSVLRSITADIYQRR